MMFSSRIFGAKYEETLSYARANDYDGVEWYFNSFRLPLNPLKRDDFLSALDQNSSLYYSFHLPTTDVELGHRNDSFARAALKYLEMYVELLAPWTTAQPYHPIFTLHVGANGISMENLDWDRTIKNLSRLEEVVQRANGILCLENLKAGWTSDPEKHLEMVREAGVAITFDAGHAVSSPFVRAGECSVVELINRLQERIRHVHLYGYERLDTGRHIAPDSWEEIRDTCQALSELPAVAGWVLELSDIPSLEKTRTLLDTKLKSVKDL